MERSVVPLVHINVQPGDKYRVQIVGNTEGILSLVTALIEATSTHGKSTAELFYSNGEVHEIQISRLDSDSAWETLELPYSDL